jgi:hypothetical protein
MSQKMTRRFVPPLRMLLRAGILVLLALIAGPHAAWSQATGSLSGTVTNTDKKPVNNTTTLLTGGVYLDIQEYRFETIYNPGDSTFNRGVLANSENGNSRRSADNNLGGLYTFDNLKPGVYNIIVEAGQLGTIHYRPQRILGVVVKPGQETTLDITLHEGTTLEEVGSPKGNTALGLRNGWIEGTVTTSDGLPVNSAKTLIVSGIQLTLKKSTGEQVRLETDRLAGGLFSCATLKPGVYDVIVDTGENGTTFYRPQIIRPVVIKPGVRTFLPITMHEGQALERITSPAVTAIPVQVTSH